MLRSPLTDHHPVSAHNKGNLPSPPLICSNMADIVEKSADVYIDDDPNFNDSDNDVYDDDDIMFDRNVTKGIDMDIHSMLEDEAALELYNSSYASSEELNYDSGSDLEQNSGRLNFPEYYGGNEKKNPHMEVGLLFASFDELKNVVRDYAVFNRVEPIFKRNDKDRIHCVCKDGCTWKLWASKLQGRETVQIKTYEPKHTCFKVRKNMYATYKWLAEYYRDDFRADPTWKTRHFRSTVRKDFGLDITKVVAWNTRKYAKVLLEGSDEEQFALLHRYGAELKRTNPGSTVIIAQVDNVFKGIYICIDACKRGFLHGCRRFVGVDGCFLKGKYDGQLLAAVGVDANDCMYPIAYAIVEKENTSSWRWFLMLLSEDLSMENWSSVTFMSDRQKGLVNVIADIFSEAEHRFCVRHMYQNFFRSDFKGKYLKDCLWGAAKASHLASFKYWMAKIEAASPKAYGWLKAKPPTEWSRSHFSDQSKCEILLNNLCECFNKFILEEREKSILMMLIGIQNKLMKRIQVKRDKLTNYNKSICPKVQKILEKFADAACECILHWNGANQYQVECSNGEYVVDVENRKCACRRWEISGIPCPHAIACILEKGHEIKDYVSKWYTVETYMSTYEHVISPINGKALWPESEQPSVLPPPWYIAKKGRKQTKRRKGPEEHDPCQSQSHSQVSLKKKGVVFMTCSICGQKGHNRRFHKEKKTTQAVGASANEMRDDQSSQNVQPVAEC